MHSQKTMRTSTLDKKISLFLGLRTIICQSRSPPRDSSPDFIRVCDPSIALERCFSELGFRCAELSPGLSS